jgi:hypothetical protein
MSPEHIHLVSFLILTNPKEAGKDCVSYYKKTKEQSLIKAITPSMSKLLVAYKDLVQRNKYNFTRFPLNIQCLFLKGQG